MIEEKKSNKKSAEELSQYIKELAQFKYDSEIRREDSLISQAGKMQSAFSFTSAALFMVATIAVENKEPWSYEFLLVIFSSITSALIASLVLATVAQRRVVREDIPDIEEMFDFINENYDELEAKAGRDVQWIQLLSKVQKDLKRTNDNKVVFIKWSMRLFYIAIGLSVFWFIIAMIKM